LVVAIPTVLVFNWLSGQIALYERQLVNGGSEFIDRLETGGGGSLALAQGNERDEATLLGAPVAGAE
jgi:hypothetical protein